MGAYERTAEDYSLLNLLTPHSEAEKLSNKLDGAAIVNQTMMKLPRLQGKWDYMYVNLLGCT